MANIITGADLAPWVGRTAGELDMHPFALAVMGQASNLVRGAAKQLTWGEVVDGVLVPVPARAKDIAVQVAARVFTNPRMLERRGSGPITETFAQEMLTGMALRPVEQEELYSLRASKGGLWTISTSQERTEGSSWTRPYIMPNGVSTEGVSMIEPWGYW